jgi:hypothetical protein
MNSPAFLRELSVIAVCASTLLAAPTFACQNPALSRGAAKVDLAGRVLPASLPVTDEVVADYQPITGDTVTVVGLWHAVFRIGDADGPVFDEVFEQFHADGLELIISNGLPPALGNVCVGVWKRVGARTYKLRHTTWNWAPEPGGFGVPGSFAGYFELEVTLRLDAHGQRFTGTFSAKNFNPAGDHLEDLDASGVVNGVRITVD